MGKAIDLTPDQRFGKLTVVERAGTHKQPNGQSVSLWLCKCDCGQEKTVRGGNLRKGNTKSCGCFQREQVRRSRKTHGHKSGGGNPSATYISWNSLKSRCLNPNSKNFKDYGGANPPVTICERWLGKEGFSNFLLDLGERPVGTSLGRFGDVGNYEKSNCAWQTSADQVTNRRPDRNLGCCKKKITEEIAA